MLRKVRLILNNSYLTSNFNVSVLYSEFQKSFKILDLPSITRNESFKELLLSKVKMHPKEILLENLLLLAAASAFQCKKRYLI